MERYKDIQDIKQVVVFVTQGSS